MAKCPYGKCDVDEGDDYCEGCLKELREYQKLAERVKRMPASELETPEGQRQVKDAVQAIWKMLKGQ